MRTDVTVWDDVEALAEAAYERYGAVHVVCNNAGVVTRGAAWEQSLEDWRWVIGVDLWGVIHGVKAFVPAHAGLAASPDTSSARHRSPACSPCPASRRTTSPRWAWWP